MTKRRLKIMQRAYSRPSLKVSSRTVSRSGNIAETMLFNQVGITLKDTTRPMMENNKQFPEVKLLFGVSKFYFPIFSFF